ncbi:MAG: sodium:proton symporter [Deltaproteobacteria bacterium HGW-Deltaproteobacteria-21]|nr:MAG: sodium:proton symporter [Deltaproteobacteria bacterium HGW-Deltaproteobacteria-21]
MRGFSKTLKEQWFLLGLLVIAGLTLMDGTGVLAGGGKWLKGHHGPDGVIGLIFFMSGLILSREEIRSGLGDVRGTLAAIATITLLAPIAAVALNLLPLATGLRIGLFLTAVMPTTLTSGVVMTGAAGGNMAHALLITLLSNGIGVVTVPFSLSLLLGIGKELEAVPIDRWAMMVQIASLVLAPLLLGIALRPRRDSLLGTLRKAVPIINQGLVLAILWMAFSEARSSVIGGGAQIVAVLLLSSVFHALLVAGALVVSKTIKLGPGRRESVVFMGGQKTLPLSILIQTTLFPQYGLALAFCVVHHFVHLIMDGYLVNWFRKRPRSRR